MKRQKNPAVPEWSAWLNQLKKEALEELKKEQEGREKK